MHALKVSGEADRDVDRFDPIVDPNEPSCFGIDGYAGPKRRFVARLALHAVGAQRHVQIALIVTKGAQEATADGAQLGAYGAHFGNSILIAASLHVAVFYLRAAGIDVLANVPHDARVRARYVRMGFDNGERLELGSEAALTKIFRFVENVYKQQQRPLALTRPPLPL